jgi:membrane protein implicated in regulation of membrane protease activity
MEMLLAPEFKPFAIASAMLLGLIAIEGITLVLGFSLSHFVEKSFHIEMHHHDADRVFGWLNAGRVPILILIILALGYFAAAGFALQSIARALWAPLPSLVASGVAVAIAVPLMRWSSSAIARLIPRDETYAVETATLLGRTAEVTVGPLDEGLPGRVKVKDAHGNWHFPRARAAKGHAPMPIGSPVLLVDHEASCFLAIAAKDELLNDR